MINFKDYIKKLNESLDSEYEISWNEIDTNLIGYFNSENNRYRILILDKSFDSYLIKFQVLDGNSWGYKSLKTENLETVLKIFSTLQKAYINFIETHSPNLIIFISIDDKSGRELLYNRFCSKVCEKFNEYYSDKVGDIFIIYKDNYNEDELKEIYTLLVDQNYKFDEWD